MSGTSDALLLILALEPPLLPSHLPVLYVTFADTTCFASISLPLPVGVPGIPRDGFPQVLLRMYTTMFYFPIKRCVLQGVPFDIFRSSSNALTF